MGIFSRNIYNSHSSFFFSILQGILSKEKKKRSKEI